MTSICGGCSNFVPEPIDLSDWKPYLYPKIKNDCPGSTFGAEWDIQDDGYSVIQRKNGQQAMFCSPFKILDEDFGFFSGPVTFTGQVKVEEPPEDEDRDDDYWGFALGFNKGDQGPGGSSRSADYVLIDWKRDNQRYSNSCRQNEPDPDSDPPQCNRYEGYDPRGSNEPVDACTPVQCQNRRDLPDEWNQATEGLAATQVLGLAHADIMWSHQVCEAINNDEGNFRTGFVQELKRGQTFGDKGWEYSRDRDKAWYDFRFDISSDVIRVYVDDCDTPEMIIRATDLIGRNEFNNGLFCFYNYSQVSL